MLQFSNRKIYKEIFMNFQCEIMVVIKDFFYSRIVSFIFNCENNCIINFIINFFQCCFVERVEIFIIVFVECWSFVDINYFYCNLSDNVIRKFFYNSCFYSDIVKFIYIDCDVEFSYFNFFVWYVSIIIVFFFQQIFFD